MSVKPLRSIDPKTTSGQVLSFLGFGLLYFVLASRSEDSVPLGSLATMGMTMGIVGLFFGLIGLAHSFDWRGFALLAVLQACYWLVSTGFFAG